MGKSGESYAYVQEIHQPNQPKQHRRLIQDSPTAYQ